MATRRTTKRRHAYSSTRVPATLFKATNPYPWLPWPEALVKLELEKRNLVFSSRWFDPKWSPLLMSVVQGFQPEFTLPYDKICILIVGPYVGNVPDIIDKNALAKVVLESQGWKVAIWYDQDILTGLSTLFHKDLPVLDAGGHHGKEILSPMGVPTFLTQLKQKAAAARKLVTTSRGGKTHAKRRRRGRRTRHSG